MKFTAVYKKRKKWYVGWVEEIPGVNTQGKTLGETKENLKEVESGNISILPPHYEPAETRENSE